MEKIIYLSNPIFYSNQESHKAIQPSNIKNKLIKMSHLNSNTEKLYLLIWNKFTTPQMTPVKYKSIIRVTKDNEFKSQKKRR